MVVKRRPPMLRVSQSVCTPSGSHVTLASFWGSVMITQRKTHWNLFGHWPWMETPAGDMTALTNKRISFWHIQHVVISGRSTEGHIVRHSMLETQRPLCLLYYSWAYLMRAISSMRPPFPLYKQEALIPSLLLATDSKSDKVPYTATTWSETQRW